MRQTLYVRTLIRGYFQEDAKLKRKLKKAKVAEGFCGGRITCMVRSKDRLLVCDVCLQASRVHQRTNKRSEYGEIRAKERKLEAAERKRAAKAGKQAA